MYRLSPVHGGTDCEPDPQFDFSTNANPLGPCPAVLSYVRQADLTRYPDPLYTQLRLDLATYHGVSPSRVVVGSGASELILRIIQCCEGAVQQLVPTFSEYARCARVVGRKLVSARTPRAFLHMQCKRPGVGFICCPNNPTGDVWMSDFISAAAAAGPLVVDLAYGPLCDASMMTAIEAAAANAYRLYSPNKAFGLTGIRGAYLITPRLNRQLVVHAPSWVIGRCAEAMLKASLQPDARAWLSRSIPRFVRWRQILAASLEQMGVQVKQSPSTYLLAHVGNARRVTTELRWQGLRVRDGTSFGLGQWIRLSAQRPVAQQLLIEALTRTL